MTEKIYSIPEIQTILFPVFRRNNVKKAIRQPAAKVILICLSTAVCMVYNL